MDIAFIAEYKRLNHTILQYGYGNIFMLHLNLLTV